MPTANSTAPGTIAVHGASAAWGSSQDAPSQIAK
jgi:hypothetical protein